MNNPEKLVNTIHEYLLYILTSIWVLRISKAVLNLLFHVFWEDAKRTWSFVIGPSSIGVIM